MQRRLESDTADPQKARSRCVSCVSPRERTSVAVSDRAQQKDYLKVRVEVPREFSWKQTYQVQLSQSPSSVRNTHNGLVGQVCAIGKD